VRTVLLNLPHPRRVMRRWVASYYAPNFLMPPLELMGLAAIVREWKRGDVRLIDAIADEWDTAKVIGELRRDPPDLLVSLTGFNTFPRDMAVLEELRAALPGTRIGCFGYLPSQRPREVLERSSVDFVLREEPELTFSELYDRLAAGEPDGLGSVAGLAYRGEDGVHVNPERPRIRDLDALPFPDHSLLHLDRYNESYLERPIATIVSERGCPFACTYCVREFGRQVASRSPESILAEIAHLEESLGIRNIRFMDDTFTMNRKRLERICERLIARHPRTAWTCLTRVDVVDAGLLDLMRRSGCRRVYVGIESGSQRILDFYRKGLAVDEIRRQMAVIRASGIEASAFFVLGAPIETDEDVDASIDLAIDLDLDYVIVTKLQYWPGTDLFATHGTDVRFDLFSGEELLYAPAGYERVRDWQRRFYRRFYLRPRYVRKRLGKLLRSPVDVASGFAKLCGFLVRRHGWDDFI
jgi:radical SAM superfamily enzyme YgiQ (UPF0313 family)